MTSWEFADAYPVLTERKAERIVLEHGLDPEEAREELTPEQFVTTAELLAWLGY